METDEARALVASARVARLATVNPGLGVDVVPLTFALIEGDRLVSIVDQKPKSTTRLRRLTNIRAHPEVTVLVDHYEDDWERLWWVRMRGTATVITEGDAFTEAVDALTERYPQYVDAPPPGPVVSVVVDAWSGWRAD
ncbi:MAG: TIGR03668 family PPOX class F420-dependent oxidoreductase [Acidimicrobiales bacterium]